MSDTNQHSHESLISDNKSLHSGLQKVEQVPGHHPQENSPAVTNFPDDSERISAITRIRLQRQHTFPNPNPIGLFWGLESMGGGGGGAF